MGSEGNDLKNYQSSKFKRLIRLGRNNINNKNNRQHYYAKKILQQNTSVKINATDDNGDIGDLVISDGDIELKDKDFNEIDNDNRRSSLVEIMHDYFSDKIDFKHFNMWLLYCYLITFWIPSPLLARCGKSTHEMRVAWREKIALLSLILFLGIFVGFLTFGFNRTVCSQIDKTIYFKDNFNDNLIIHGRVLDMKSFEHVEVPGIVGKTNFMNTPYNFGGYDASFLFQNVNGNCKGLVTPKDNCAIPHDGDGNLAWYFPCKMIDKNGQVVEPEQYHALDGLNDGWGCHTSERARNEFYNMEINVGVHFQWEDLKNSSNNLVVLNGNVLDLNRLDYLDKSNLNYPIEFDELKTSNLDGYDLSLFYTTKHQKNVLRCLSELTKVGIIDTKSVGCLISDITLYVSLVIVLSVVFSKFAFACYFKWGVAKNQGLSKVDNKTFLKLQREIENWSNIPDRENDLESLNNNLEPKETETIEEYLLNFNNKVSKSFPSLYKLRELQKSSIRISTDEPPEKVFTTMPLQNHFVKQGVKIFNKSGSNSLLNVTSSSTLIDKNKLKISQPFFDKALIHEKAIAQPELNYSPFNFPLVYTVCFVTCYSEDEDGIRATLDSLTATDYPDSHKLLMVICDGLVKGSNSEKKTPDIILGMMEDFTHDVDSAEPYSYISVAVGSKRHNMAKVYSGFYYYKGTDAGNNGKRVPIVTIVKCGVPEEGTSLKPGNRGKRDSQVIMMSFFQKLLFNDRMTELEYQLLKGIWQVTGINATFYELILMVDADTKVYPNSVSHMVAEMVKDPLIMGLCGETKIINKSQSWVTAIQVFEYYISHHQTKAFESVFGSVTCLPGCFSMYRLKAPKGTEGFWVPILINPDVVEKYADNVANTLHKKNLLLLGEDRFLSSLLLKTFPRRKMVFVPKAACKTLVPDTFKVLLSQRRRWINSTIHNLLELVLIKDLCGTFCFSMQFFIFIELIGTLVLPLAICFTIYVIIFAITSQPTPVITLILLALILGLPGILVIVTATRLSYIVWLCIYIVALPVWNFILPAYAFWKFDDFSWGDTRAVEGESKNDHDCTDEGVFDHSNIKLKNLEDHLKADYSQNVD